MPATSSAGSTCAGTGSAGGIATDEYSDAERDDLVAVVDHLATRDWSTGAVGMFGTSYGGFTSLQVAVERPPALKADRPHLRER